MAYSAFCVRVESRLTRILAMLYIAVTPICCFQKEPQCKDENVVRYCITSFDYYLRHSIIRFTLTIFKSIDSNCMESGDDFLPTQSVYHETNICLLELPTAITLGLDITTFL